MSKVGLRLLVVILIVIISVAIATAIFLKPDKNKVLFSYWQSSVANSRYDIDAKIDKNFGGATTFANRKLKDEAKIEKIATVSLGIDNYLNNLLKISSQSEDVDDESLKYLSQLLEEYCDSRIGKDSTGYWIDYCYDRVHDPSFNPGDATEMGIYEDLVSTIENRWIVQAQLGAKLAGKLDAFVTKFCFNKQHTIDLKNVLLNFESVFASAFVNPTSIPQEQTLYDYYLAFCNEHLSEYRVLAERIGQELNVKYLDYSENDLYLSNHYFSVSSKTLNDFVISTDKSTYIDSLSNQIEKRVLQIIYNQYLGGH